jgi:hypothetical protein
MDNLPEFLTYDEVAEVDSALLTAQDKFLARVSLYSLRVLKQISEQENLPVEAITDQQIAAWVEKDAALRQVITTDATFEQFFIRLVLSSLQPLKLIAQEQQVSVADLSIQQVVSWFEQQAKIRLSQTVQ